MAKGTTLYTKVNLRSESTYGTGTEGEVQANSRRMAVGPTGIIAFGEEWDLGSDRTIGIRNPVVQGYQTLTAKNPTISLESPAVPTDELPYYLSMLQEATSSDVDGLAKTWVYDLGGEVTVEPPTSMAAIISDGNDNFLVNGIALTSLELSAQSSGTTSLSASGFAKSISNDDIGPATVGFPTISPRAMAGRVWQAKLWAAFPYSVPETTGTAFEHLYDWSLSLTSGNAPIAAQIGNVTNAGINPYGAAFSGTLSMTVASTPDTTSALLDERGANVFVELAWADAGSPAHAVNIYAAGIISSVEPLSGDQDGITTHAVEITLAYDPETEQTVQVSVTNEMSDLIGTPYID